jgi:hypothetical protein
MKTLLATAAALAVAASAASATEYQKPQAQYVTVKTPVVSYQPVTRYVPVTQYKAVTTYKPVVSYKEEQKKVYVAPAPKPVYRPVYAYRAPVHGYRAW